MYNSFAAVYNTVTDCMNKLCAQLWGKVTHFSDVCKKISHVTFSKENKS